MSENKSYVGLSDIEVESSRRTNGSNVLTPRKKESLWKLFFEKFEDPMIRILLVAAALSFVISVIHNEYAETIGIFCAILLATGIAFWFEKDAQKKFDALNKVTDLIAVKVIRNGIVTEVAKSDIVVGDIVLFETGEEIVADGELLESSTLLIDESSLTGELSIAKTTDPAAFDDEATYPSNRVYRSTKVLEGNGVMHVSEVGDQTQYGKVAILSTEKSEELTPLARQLESLAKLVGICGFSLAVMTFMILLVKDMFYSSEPYSLSQVVTLFTSLAVLSLATIKMWLPIIHDYFKSAKKEVKLLDYISKRSWLTNILVAFVLFGVAAIVSRFVFEIDFFSASSWVNITEAGRILQFFMVAVTLIVVSVPEGLPMSVTLSLALSMRRMLKSNNLVRKMHACETMGATTVICTDKTGTLTQNQMRVHKQFFDGFDKFDSSALYSSVIAESIALNTTAHIDYSHETPKTIGNPTESALLLWCKDVGIDYNRLRERSVIVDRLNFSTERKYMATVINSSLVNKRLLLVKGAPEVVISKCKNALTSEGLLKEIDRAAIDQSLFEMQNKAMRTLAFAYKVLDEKHDNIENEAESGMIYVGYVAIADPVRDDVAEAVAQCTSASIAIKIVTGDTSVTAKEIARQIGLWKESDGEENIITGVDFADLSDEEAYERVAKLKIMCRARPADKQRLVALLQKRGEVVAVTGDGTNDAPALNRAHVGLSMGTGTAIAKEASDITLLDDSFASIVSAVVWGRSLYLNIQRFIVFQLTINVTAMLIVLLGSIFGNELPLTVTQMLWVNLIMDTFAAGALASLPPNRKLLQRPPRRSNAFIITREMGSVILTVGGLFVVSLMGYMFFFMGKTQDSTYELTQFFTAFVLLQFWNMFNAKAFGTSQSAFSNLKESKSFMFVALLILVGQWIIVTFGGEVFRTVPLSLKDWIITFAITSLVLVIGFIYRIFKKSREA